MIDVLKPLIKQFMPFAQKQMGFNRPPKLFLRQNSQNSADPLGKTGFYDPANESITIYITDRHPKDVMRSLAHELMHHTQKCNGDFDSVENMGEQGYAQNDSHLRSMEIQAYEASIVFRDWEDSIKGTIYNESLQKGANENMTTKNWKNKEINSLLTEKWGFKMDLDALNERRTGSGVDHTVSDPETEEEAGEQETRGTATSKRGIPSAAGSVTHPKAGRIDRTDIANKAPAEWLKEDEGPKFKHWRSREDVPAKKSSMPGAMTKEPDTDEEWEAFKACKRGCEGEEDIRKCVEDCRTADMSLTSKMLGKGKEYASRVSKAVGGPRNPLGSFEEGQLFEEATTTCNQRHQIQGDKAVRQCIEEEMTRLMKEGCPHEEEEEEEMELYEEEPVAAAPIKITVSEERIREIAKVALKHFRTNNKR